MDQSKKNNIFLYIPTFLKAQPSFWQIPCSWAILHKGAGVTCDAVHGAETWHTVASPCRRRQLPLTLSLISLLSHSVRWLIYICPCRLRYAYHKTGGQACHLFPVVCEAALLRLTLHKMEVTTVHRFAWDCYAEGEK